MASSSSPAAGRLPEGGFIWRDLSWSGRSPAAVVEPLADGVPSGTVLRVPLAPGAVLGVRLLRSDEPASGLWCAGFAHGEFDDQGEPRFRTVPCPKSNRLTKGTQCGLCRHLDRFLPIHRAHRGAQLTEAAAAYAARPHWLYVATFPDGTSKVGTAHERSQVSRLDQQAVAAASWVALAEDGVVVRRLEDAMTEALGLRQMKRVSSKFTAWLDPWDAGELEPVHRERADAARRELDSLALESLALESLADGGFEVKRDLDWSPSGSMLRPQQVRAVRGTVAVEGYARWEEQPRRFAVRAGIGPFLAADDAAAPVKPTGESEPTGVPEPTGGPGPRWLLNTAVLKNRACAAVGEDAVSDDGAQGSLF